MSIKPQMSSAHVMINEIMKRLMAKDKVRTDRILENFILENHKLGGPKEGFLLEGRFLTLLPSRDQLAAEKRMLHPHLHGEVREYLNELKLIENEASTIKHGLSLLLKPCKTWQDFRDALPEDIVDLVPEIKRLSRQRPEAWCLDEGSFQKHQYSMVKEKMMFYITNQMLY